MPKSDVEYLNQALFAAEQSHNRETEREQFIQKDRVLV